MAVYERETRVRAPFEDVWAFHSDVDGLDALTPDWTGLRIDAVTGPDGEPDPDVLVAGTRIEMSVQPFKIGPRQSWTSEITAREHGDDSAYFRDVMEDGPFPTWEHTHMFYRDGPHTLLRDTVAYETPVRAADPFAKLGFGMMFRERHRRTRALLEG